MKDLLILFFASIAFSLMGYQMYEGVERFEKSQNKKEIKSSGDWVYLKDVEVHFNKKTKIVIVHTNGDLEDEKIEILKDLLNIRSPCLNEDQCKYTLSLD